jgi:hypothetical protein
MKSTIAFVVCLLVVSKGAHAEGCDQPPSLKGTDTPYSLWGKCLGFSPLSDGMRIPLGSIVQVLPNAGSQLTLTADRAVLTDEFLRDVFEAPRKEELRTHPLLQRGIGLTVTPNELQITLQPTVILNLRTDMPEDPSYRTYKGSPDFTVRSAPAKAFASTELSRISREFSDVFVHYKARAKQASRTLLPDGRSRWSVDTEDLPRAQEPRMTN